MIIALHGYTPTATKNVPPYRTWARLATSNMMYPAIATTLPAAMIGPLALILSDSSEVKRTVTKAAKFGGTVKSCAVVVLVYPRPVMMVGRKREKLCFGCQHCRARRNMSSWRSRGWRQGMAGWSHIKRYQEEEPDQRREPRLRCLECHLDPMPVEPFLVHIGDICSTVCIFFQASHGESSLLLGQKLGICGSVRHEEETDNPEDCRYNSLD